MVCLIEPEEASTFNHTSLVERAIKCFATADSCFEKKKNFYQKRSKHMPCSLDLIALKLASQLTGEHKHDLVKHFLVNDDMSS